MEDDDDDEFSIRIYNRQVPVHYIFKKRLLIPTTDSSCDICARTNVNHDVLFPTCIASIMERYKKHIACFDCTICSNDNEPHVLFSNCLHSICFNCYKKIDDVCHLC